MEPTKMICFAEGGGVHVEVESEVGLGRQGYFLNMYIAKSAVL